MGAAENELARLVQAENLKQIFGRHIEAGNHSLQNSRAQFRHFRAEGLMHVDSRVGHLIVSSGWPDRAAAPALPWQAWRPPGRRARDVVAVLHRRWQGEDRGFPVTAAGDRGLWRHPRTLPSGSHG